MCVNGIANNYIKYVDLATRIQKRLAIILMNLPHRQVRKDEKEKTNLPKAYTCNNQLF